jgi:dimethylglycine oxidase
LEAGLAFTVRKDGSDFLGCDGLATRPTTARRLGCLSLEPGTVMTGGEPVVLGEEPVGYVTSAAWGPSVERSIAYAWLPTDVTFDDVVAVRSFDRSIVATVVDAPLFDPEGARLRA